LRPERSEAALDRYSFKFCLLAQILTRCKPLRDKYVVLPRSHQATKPGDRFRRVLLCTTSSNLAFLRKLRKTYHVRQARQKNCVSRRDAGTQGRRMVVVLWSQRLGVSAREGSGCGRRERGRAGAALRFSQQSGGKAVDLARDRLYSYLDMGRIDAGRAPFRKCGLEKYLQVQRASNDRLINGKDQTTFLIMI
jgi:hypothetical protein